jgi:rsbT co-antagonist protein RsbR
MTACGNTDESIRSATLDVFTRVLHTAPILLWAVDAEGNFTLANGKGLELLGLTTELALQTNALEMHKDHPEIAQAFIRALGGEESRIVSNPSPGVYFENWYVPLRRDETGEVYGIAGLSIDASERMRGEIELREKLAVIERQSATIRALATPIIQVWDDVLCLPVIGTVDSARTAEMMQALLEAIVREQARYAIVDLTGVQVVDTSTADHLIQLFRAAKVLGVEGILCGIRPAVAQTVVALGLELASVQTMRSLRDALKWCIRARQSGAAATTTNPFGKAAPPVSEATGGEAR